MTLTDEDRDLILGALDTLGMALTEYDHVWDAGQKAVYETAIELLTGKKDLPRGNYVEREPDEGEEWKG